MVMITIAFLAGLCGAFIMRSARASDRRLVVAGYSPGEAIWPRLFVLGIATLLAVVVSLGVTGLSFTPESWFWFTFGNVLIGVLYASFGALAGALLSQLGATYVVLFFAMLGTGILQNPMSAMATRALPLRFCPTTEPRASSSTGRSGAALRVGAPWHWRSCRRQSR